MFDTLKSVKELNELLNELYSATKTLTDVDLDLIEKFRNKSTKKVDKYSAYVDRWNKFIIGVDISSSISHYNKEKDYVISVEIAITRHKEPYFTIKSDYSSIDLTRLNVDLQFDNIGENSNAREIFATYAGALSMLNNSIAENNSEKLRNNSDNVFLSDRIQKAIAEYYR